MMPDVPFHHVGLDPLSVSGARVGSISSAARPVSVELLRQQSWSSDCRNGSRQSRRSGRSNLQLDSEGLADSCDRIETWPGIGPKGFVQGFAGDAGGPRNFQCLFDVG